MKWVIDNSGFVNTSVSGKAYTFSKSHPHYSRLIHCLKHNNVEHFEVLYDIGSAIESYTQGAVQIKNGSIYWDEHPMPEMFTDRVFEMKKSGVDFQPMLNFLDNLSDNPSDKSIVELFDFMQHKDLPITPDGCFLAYKAVTNNFKDKYSGNFDNGVGNIVEVSRQSVDGNRDTHCGSGLHVGSIDYVLGYGAGTSKDDDGNISCSDGGDQIVVCKVNPKDVVSVPTDCKFQKLRTCRYEVVSILKSVYSQPVVGLVSPIQAKSNAPTPELVRKIGRVSRLLATAGR